MTAGLIVLRPQDAAKLASFEAREKQTTGQDEAAWMQTLRAGHVLALGVEDPSGALLAYLTTSLTPDFADIIDLLVARSHRRQGLARRLIQAMATHAGERGIARIGLDVSETNRPARQLYESLGFTEDRRRESYYSDGSAALVMSRSVAGFAGLGQ